MGLTNDNGICYQRGDLSQLTLPAQAYGLVYSQLTLHYLSDIEHLFTTLYEVLQPGD